MAKKIKNVPAQGTIQKSLKVAGTLLKDGRSENSFQSMIERYQLANYNADYSTDARLKRAHAIRLALEKRAVALAKANLPTLANYDYLTELYNKSLSQLTEKIFAMEAGIRIERDLGKARGPVTKEQESVIATFHGNTAKSNWDKLEEIRITLVTKGKIKGKADDKKTLPTEAEKAAMLKNAEQQQPTTQTVAA